MGRQRMEKEVGKTATDEEIAYERHQIPLLPLSLKHTDNKPQEFIPTDTLHTGQDAAQADSLGSTARNCF